MHEHAYKHLTIDEVILDFYLEEKTKQMAILRNSNKKRFEFNFFLQISVFLMALVAKWLKGRLAMV